MTETNDLTAWADAEIHDMDADDWAEVNSAAGLPRTLNPDRDAYEALLAARDRVLAGLDVCERSALARMPDRSPPFDSASALWSARLVTPGRGPWIERTNLGHELARCIEENRK